MFNLLAAGASYLFPGVRAVKLFKAGTKIANSSNPLVLAKNVSLTVLDCCAPPPVRLTAHCLAAGSLVVVSLVSPNPITSGCALHVISELYEECS